MEKKFLGSTGLAKFLEKLYDVFSEVGHTHTKSQITDFPDVPTNTSQLTNDSGFITAGEVDSIITVDSQMSETSMNPVQNKIIKAEFDDVHALIGSESVADQIDSAVNTIINEIPQHTAISNDIIDSICGATVYSAREVMF